MADSTKRFCKQDSCVCVGIGVCRHLPSKRNCSCRCKSWLRTLVCCCCCSHYHRSSCDDDCVHPGVRKSERLWEVACPHRFRCGPNSVRPKICGGACENCPKSLWNVCSATWAAAVVVVAVTAVTSKCCWWPCGGGATPNGT